MIFGWIIYNFQIPPILFAACENHFFWINHDKYFRELLFYSFNTFAKKQEIAKTILPKRNWVYFL